MRGVLGLCSNNKKILWLTSFYSNEARFIIQYGRVQICSGWTASCQVFDIKPDTKHQDVALLALDIK